MAKMTIYVQDELKAEMDRYESQQPNWSSIAQEAFTLECQRLKTRKKGAGKMEKVVERLRASRDAAANQTKLFGHQAGREWAMEKATYTQLKRLHEWELPSKLRYPWAEEVYAAIFRSNFLASPDTADVGDIADECSDFWMTLSGLERPPDDYVLAFLDGAVEIFAEVKGKVEELHPRRSKC